MTWTKLSDDFADDGWTLSDEAFRLHVEGLVWSNRKLLDLVLSKDDVRRFAKHPEAVTELVDGGWWAEAGDDYVIRHHGSYQQTRTDVLARQERARKNGARSEGRPPKVPRERFTETQVGTQTETQVGSDVGTKLKKVVSPPASTAAPEKPTSVPQVETQAETQRDGTGQDRKGSKKQPPTEVSEADWPTVRLCRVCRSPLDPKLPDDTHPNCEAAA